MHLNVNFSVTEAKIRIFTSLKIVACGCLLTQSFRNIILDIFLDLFWNFISLVVMDYIMQTSNLIHTSLVCCKFFNSLFLQGDIHSVKLFLFSLFCRSQGKLCISLLLSLRSVCLFCLQECLTLPKFILLEEDLWDCKDMCCSRLYCYTISTCLVGYLVEEN